MEIMMTDSKTSKEVKDNYIEVTYQNPDNFKVEPDTTKTFWNNNSKNTLPPPDMLSAYGRNRLPPKAGIEKRKAYIIGSGIAGLSAAFYMIRDAGLPGENITILDTMSIEGGSLDGAGNPEDGFIIRGGREMNWNYDNVWDMFQDVPALELPEGYSVLDEYRLVNDNDSNYSKARLMHQQGKIKDFSKFGLSKSQQFELIQLLLKRKEDLDDITVEQYFSKGFLETNFWMFWRTMFAFQNWHSVLEMKLYMHRFLDSIDGFSDLSALVFPKYNQYDTFITPLFKMLKAKGVKIQYKTRAYDLDFAVDGDAKTVTAIKCINDGKEESIAIAPDDVVVALTGSMTESSTFGDMENAPAYPQDLHNPKQGSDWELWLNLAQKSSVFGKPKKFCGDIQGSAWESVTLTCKPSVLTEKVKELSVNDPYSGKTATGGIVTFDDSNWILSFTCNRQPHFPSQPKDVLVLWVYALLMDKDGNYVKKPMPQCNGKEILQELCYHLGIIDKVGDVIANTKVRSALLPYITAQFMPRAAGDRPHIIPEGCTNLALVGQFVETNNDIVFTVDSSVRTGRVAAYSLFDVKKQVPDISPTQYDIRNLIKAARAINNNEPFIGERLLHKILGKTYFAHILPPLPKEDKARLVSGLEEDVNALLQKGGETFNGISSKLSEFWENLSHKTDK